MIDGIKRRILNWDNENQITQFNARAGPIPYIPNDLQPANTIATSPVTTNNAQSVNCLD